MASEANDVAISRLKAVKSAYIIEADASMASGHEAAAMDLFVKAAGLELELADWFESRSEQVNAQISRFSAASCFFRARQYRRASELFEQLLAVFPEARKLIAECEGKEDVPLTGATPGLQALIDLLVKKKLIDEAEWAQAIATH